MMVSASFWDLTRQRMSPLAHRDAAGAADGDFPIAAFRCDDADVLGGRFGAVSRAAADGHLDFGGGLDALEFFLDGDAEAVESLVPKRHHSLPTQVLQVRKALV